MPIQINPLELGPLAAAASARTGNLGIEPDWYRKAKLQEQYSEMQNQQVLQQLSNQGALQREAAAARYQAALEQNIKQPFQAAQNEKDRQIQQNQLKLDTLYKTGLLQNDQTKTTNEANYQNNHLALLGQQLQDQADYHKGELGFRNQELAETSDFHKGELADRAQEREIQKDVAQKQMDLAHTRAAIEMTKEQRNLAGSYGAAILNVLSTVRDPEKQKETIKAMTADAVSQGQITQEQADKFNNATPQQMYAYGSSLVSGMAGGNEVLKSLSGNPQLQSTLNNVPGSNGTMIAPLSKDDMEKNVTGIQTIDAVISQAQDQINQLKQNKEKGIDYFNFGGKLKGAVGAVEGGLGISGGPEQFHSQRSAFDSSMTNLGATVVKGIGDKNVSNRNIQIGLGQIPTLSNTVSNDEAITKLNSVVKNFSMARNQLVNNYQQGGVSLSPTGTSSNSTSAPSTGGLTLNGTPYSKDTHDQFIKAILEKNPGASPEDAAKYLQSQLAGQ